METVLAVLTVALLTGQACGEPLPADKVPLTVRKAFEDKFPGVHKVEWKLKSDKTYEAEFKRKGVEVAAKFDKTGKWLETETAIEPSALPKAVRATIAKDFKGYKPIETQQVERPGNEPMLFEVHVEKGEEIVKVQLDGKGKVVSKGTKKKGKGKE